MGIRDSLGVGLTAPGRAATPAPSTAPITPSGGTTVGAGGEYPAVTTTSLASGGAIAYPYFGGSAGIAPDHTIVVTGVGQADLQPDGSDRAAAQKSAIADALADAKAQADAIASATGLSINGVLSVSASVSPGYGIMPMMANGAGTTSCPVPVPQGGPSTEKPVPPQLDCGPADQQTVSVSVTVEYRVS
jgi:hypothetical protein